MNVVREPEPVQVNWNAVSPVAFVSWFVCLGAGEPYRPSPILDGRS
jgi:hypothetical protein